MLEEQREEVIMEICAAYQSKAEKNMSEDDLRRYMTDVESKLQTMSDKELKKTLKKSRKGKV